MFSVKVIQNKLKKAETTRASKDKNTAKKKRKNGKIAAKKAVRSKRPRLASSGGGGGGGAVTRTDTDVNKNKVKRLTKNKNKDKRLQTKNERNRRTKREENAPSQPRVPVLYRNTEKTTHIYNSDIHEPLGRETELDFNDSFPYVELGESQRVNQDFEHSFTLLENQERDFGVVNDCYNTEDSCSMPKKKRRPQHVPEVDETSANLIGECLTSTETASGSVVAALGDNTTLYLQGSVVLKPLLGSIEVLGCVLQQGESQTVYSLPSCSLLGVEVKECGEVVPGSGFLQTLPSDWVDGLVERNIKVVIIEVLPHTSPRVDLLVSAGWRSLGKPSDRQKPWHSVGAFVVTPRSSLRTRVTHIPDEWREAAQTVVMNWGCGAVPRVVVCGGKGVGKSTFFKYLANSLLSAQPEDAQAGILCLDFDPGQPELSLPTALSLMHLTKPLLGPAFTHCLDQMSVLCRHVLVGAVSPQFVLEEYTSAVRELVEAAGATEGRALPLLVNTMGWTQGTGLGLMLDVLRLVQPTHVVQLQDHRATRNYPFPLDATTVATARGGITTRGDAELHYSLMLLHGAGAVASAPNMAQPRVQRELRLLAEAGRVAEAGQRVVVPWGRVALHVCEEQVPRERILQVLNAQLVALCRVEASGLHRLQDGMPQQLAPHAGFGELVGWGVVMAVDMLAGTLHLTTTVPQQRVTDEVNALVMPRMHLPAPFYKLFSVGKGPYLEEGSHEGVGRLRVGRQVKPRGPRR